jgi:hypothetical protein
MLVEERVVDEVVRAISGLSDETSEASDVSWFAARQPGILRYLTGRCGEDSDAMAVALYYACAIEKAFDSTRANGATRAHVAATRVPRVPGSLLPRAEAAFLSEATSRGRPGGGLADRQPALAQLVADVVDGPPVPLTEFEAMRVGVALAAVVYSLDEVAFGRPVP